MYFNYLLQHFSSIIFFLKMFNKYRFWFDCILYIYICRLCQLCHITIELWLIPDNKFLSSGIQFLLWREVAYSAMFKGTVWSVMTYVKWLRYWDITISAHLWSPTNHFGTFLFHGHQNITFLGIQYNLLL